MMNRMESSSVRGSPGIPLVAFAWPLQEPAETLIFLLLVLLIGLLLVEVVDWRLPPKR